MRTLSALFFSLIAMTTAAAPLAAQDPVPPSESLEGAFPEQTPFSPYAGRNFPTQVFWGDTHVHTAMSMDAGAFGARLLPKDAYRFASRRRGGLVDRASGQALASARLHRRGRPLGQHGLLPSALRGRPRLSGRPDGEALVRHDPAGRPGWRAGGGRGHHRLHPGDLPAGARVASRGNPAYR